MNIWAWEGKERKSRGYQRKGKKRGRGWKGNRGHERREIKRKEKKNRETLRSKKHIGLKDLR